MSCIYYRAVLAACMAAVAGVSVAESAVVKFTTSNTLMAGPTADAGFATCRPLRGDLAEITGSPHKAYRGHGWARLCGIC
jgi:hypothetical protein